MEEQEVKTKTKKPQVLIPYDEFMKQTMQDGAEGEKHEVFSGLMCTDEDYAWVTSGSRLYVVNTKTGTYLSYFNFSDPDDLPGQTQYITCVEQFYVKGYSLPFLIVSTNTSKEGFISIFNPLSWMIKRRVNIGRQISCLAVVDDQIDTTQGYLSNLMSGILAVGCTDGSLILIDLRSDFFLDTSNLPLTRDSEASILKFININDNLENLQALQSTCMQTGDGLAFLLLKGKPGYHGVSALYHSKESSCLFVGFGRGSWEVWNVMNLELIYSMSSESDYPVYSFAQLEPCDDPKHVIYIWVTHQIINGSIAIMSLYSFAFEKKSNDHRGRHYMDFRTCALVFEFFPDNLFLHAEGGKLISCFSLPIKSGKKYSKLPLTGDPKALVFTGITVDYRKSSRSYLIVFDLDQWYKSQMPSSTLGATQYLDLVTVTECAVEGIDVFKRSLKFDNKGTHEVYSYPQSLSYDILCSCDSQFICVKKPSLQAAWFENVSKLGSGSLFHSFTLCKEAIRAGIIPKFSDPINMDLSSEKQTREFLMSIFLDYNLTSAIHDAILGWCKATKNSEDNDHWNFVFDWMWDTVAKIWEKANSVCSKFFDGSGVEMEHISTDYVYYSAKTIESLVHLLTDIAKNRDQQIFGDKIQQKLSSMRGMVLYLKFVHLFAKENLLPEKNMDGQPESSLLYDYNLLLKKSETLRNNLKTKFFNKFNHCLLPKTSLYLFDHVVGDFGVQIYLQWEKEGGVSSYPPSTIQSLLRICLLQNIPENVIFCIFHYFILDMIHLLPNKQYSWIKKLEKFEEMAFSKNEEYFILKGIWMLDHLLFKEGLDFFFHPKSRASSLPSAIHKAILLNFIVHDQEKIAYKYLSANGNCFSDLDDIKLEFRILLSQGMPQEAYDFLRKKKNYRDELFIQLLEASLNSPSLRDFIAKGDLDSHERKICETYFNNNNSLPAKRFHAFYLIHNKRYLEANNIQKKIRSNVSSDSLLKNIAKGFYSTMSSYAKDKEECQQLQETELAAHFVTKSAFLKPLSCFIKVGKDMSIKNVTSGKELMLAVEASSFHLDNLRKRKEIESSENAKDAGQEVPESDIRNEVEDVQMTPLYPESPMVVDTTLDHTLSAAKRSSSKRQGRRWEIPESKRRKIETLSTPTKWTSPPNFGGTPLVKKEAPIVPKERNLTHSILKSTPKKQDDNSLDSGNLTPRKNIRFCVPENIPEKSPEENIAVSSSADFKPSEENLHQESFSHDVQEVNQVKIQPPSPSKNLSVEPDNFDEELEDSFNNSYSLGFGYQEERVTKASTVIEEIDLISSDSDGNDSQPGDAQPIQEEEQNEEEINYDDDYYSSDKGSDDESPLERLQDFPASSNFEPSASADDDSSLEVVEIVRNVKAPPPQLPKMEYRQNELSLQRTNAYENSSSPSPLHYSRKSQSATSGRTNIYDTESSQSSSLHCPSNPQGAISDMIMDMVDEENSSKFSGSSNESSRSSASSQSSAEDVLEVADEEEEEEEDEENEREEEDEENEREEEDEENEREDEGNERTDNREWELSQQDPLFNPLDYEPNSMETEEVSKEKGPEDKEDSSEGIIESSHDPPYNPLDFQASLDYGSNPSALLEDNKLPEGDQAHPLDSSDDEPLFNPVGFAPMESATSIEVHTETPIDYPTENPAEENNEEGVLYDGLSAEESEEVEKVTVLPEDHESSQPPFKDDGNSMEPSEENDEKTSQLSETSNISCISLNIGDEVELDMTENTTVVQSTDRFSEDLNETDTITQEKEDSAPCLERISNEPEVVDQEKEDTAPLLERIGESDIVGEKKAPHLEPITNEPDHVEMEDAPRLERIPDPVQLDKEDPAPSLQIEKPEPNDVEMEDAEPVSAPIVSEPTEQEKEDPVATCEAATPKAPKYGRKRKYTQPLTPGYALRRSNEKLNTAIIEDSPKESNERRSRRSVRASSAEPRLETSLKGIHESLMVIEEEKSDDLPSIASSETPKRKTKTPSKKVLSNLSFEDSPQVLDQGMLASDNSSMDMTPTPTVKKGRKKPATPGIALKKGKLKKYPTTPGHALKASEALPLSEDEEEVTIEKQINSQTRKTRASSVEATSTERRFTRAASVESVGKSEKATRSSKRIAMRLSMECLDTSGKELPKRACRASSVDTDRSLEKSIKKSTEKARSSDNLISQSSTQRSRFGRIDFTDCDHEDEDSEEEIEKPKKRQIKSRKAASSAGDLEPSLQRLKEFDPVVKSSKKSTKTTLNEETPSTSTRKRGRPKKSTIAAFLKPKAESSRPLEKIAEEDVETEDNLKKKDAKKESKGVKSKKDNYLKTLEQILDKQSKERGTLLRSGKLVSYTAQSTISPRKAPASSKSKPVKKEQPSKKEIYVDEDDFKMFDSSSEE